jgi:hypothetical protein
MTQFRQALIENFEPDRNILFSDDERGGKADGGLPARQEKETLPERQLLQLANVFGGR